MISACDMLASTISSFTSTASGSTSSTSGDWTKRQVCHCQRRTSFFLFLYSCNTVDAVTRNTRVGFLRRIAQHPLKSTQIRVPSAPLLSAYLTLDAVGMDRLVVCDPFSRSTRPQGHGHPLLKDTNYTRTRDMAI